MITNFTIARKTIFSLLCFLVLGFSANAKDTIPPIINLNTPDTVRVQIGDIYAPVDPTITDNQSDSSSIKVYLSRGFNGTVITIIRGWYTETYTATDSNGNQSSKTRYIIVDDFIDPVITLNTADTVYHKIRTPYNSVPATVTDNYYAQGQVSLVKLSSDVNPNMAGTYHEIFEAVDGSLNTAHKTRVVIVGDFNSSVNRLYTSVLNIFPNPAASVLNLQIPTGTAGNVHIMSMDGKIVLDLHNVNATSVIDISSIQNGVYMIQFTNGEQLSTARLLISH
jgi:hypothetical protein